MSTWTTIRTAVTFVGAIVMLTIFAVTLLLLAGKTAPDGLIAVAAGGVGALATLLTGQLSTVTQSHLDDAGKIVTSTRVSLEQPVVAVPSTMVAAEALQAAATAATVNMIQEGVTALTGDLMIPNKVERGIQDSVNSGTIEGHREEL